MTAYLGGVAAGVACGLIAYVILRMLAPELASGDQPDLIGLAAIVGALVTAVVARRLEGRLERRDPGD